MVTMPFGKHRGQLLGEIPTSYLKWLLTISLDEWLRLSVESELESRREGFERTRAVATFDVATWYRKLSMRFHPDRGGSKEAMQAINVAKDLLEEML